MGKGSKKIILLPSKKDQPFEYLDMLHYLEEVLDRNGPTAFSDFAAVFAAVAEEMTEIMMSQARFPEADIMRKATRSLQKVAKLTHKLDHMQGVANPLDISKKD
jgi:hypothetical protein